MNVLPLPLVRSLCRLGVVLLAGAAALPARAQAEPPPVGDGITWSASAFGTIGWAQSNRPWRFQRYIDDGGTAERDTLFGAQLDVQLTPEWSATLQAKLAPSREADARWDARASWAFVAWRPNNDWLLRAGKLRVPLFLRSEQLDVGQTYDEARLPSEIYSLAPSNDFTGAHASRSWTLGGGDLSLDAYRGSARLAQRAWLSAGVPPLLPAGAQFTRIDVTVQGLVATWRTPDTQARLGLHHARTRRVDGQPFLVRPMAASFGPGLDYWQVDAGMPGPGVAGADALTNLLLTAGAELKFDGGWRVAAELVRVWQSNVELGFEGTGGYVSLYRQWGAFTPYASVMMARSGALGAYWGHTLDTTRLPAALPGADQVNATMRLFAEALPVYRQHSFALGSSYALSARSKLKLEWLRTYATQSAMIDTPAGEPVRTPRRVDVYTLNLSFVY